MSIFDLLTLLGGLALFLFGMNYMGQALEKVAGSRLKNILAKLTASPLRGLLVGAAVTAIIQSSSATTVMTVGFVNSHVQPALHHTFAALQPSAGKAGLPDHPGSG